MNWKSVTVTVVVVVVVWVAFSWGRVGREWGDRVRVCFVEGGSGVGGEDVISI